MALFQDEQTTQEQFNQEHNLVKEDIFSKLGYDEIVKERRETRNQRIEDEKRWVQNLISPDKVQEWENKGSMTAIEVWNRKNANELVPFMGTWQQGTKSLNVKSISDKMQNGEVITPEERQQFEDFVLNLAEVQTRGYTFGGGAMNIGLETIPFMAEFGIGLLTTGGTSSFGATSSKISTKVLEKSLKRKIGEGIVKTAYNATLNPRTYAFTATRLPQQVRARMGDVLLSDAVAVSPEGQAILKESEEKPAIAFMKALALTNIEVASEMTGEILVRPTLQAGAKLSKVIASPLTKHLPKEFAENFVKLAEDVTKLPFIKAVDTLGFNGILEEMGEERVGDLLKVAFDLDGEDGYSFEQLLDAMFPAPEQLAQEALSFGVTGLGMNAVHQGIKALPVAGEKYSKDGFLIDAGIFRIAGYDSYLDKRVKEELNKKGKTEEEIENAVEFSTRDDKVQFLKDVKADFDTKQEYDAKEFEKDLKRAEVEDKTYEKLTQAGVGKDIAFANAKLFGQFFRNYGADNIEAFDNWYNKFDTQYNVPVNNPYVLHQSAKTAGANNNEIAEAQKEWKEKGTESKYFKNWFDNSKVVDEKGKPLVVYHNTNVDFEVFDKSKIGSNTDFGMYGKGFYFGNSSNDYYGSKKMRVYLSLKNPFVWDKYSKEELAEILNISDSWLSENKSTGNIRLAASAAQMFNISSRLKEQGFDGVINNITDTWTEYVAFESEQIKSVENQGTFDEKNPNIYFQSVYHGTPHKFDKFSTENIGTGEGAQAHGWGLYFAENKEVSEEYRKALIKNSGFKEYLQEIKIGNFTLGHILNRMNFSSYDASSLLSYTSSFFREENKEKVIDKLNEFIDTWDNLPIASDWQQEMSAKYKKLISLLTENNIENTKKGQLFEVDIPEDEVLLDEDKKFSEQSKQIQEALLKLVEENYQDWNNNTVAFSNLMQTIYTDNLSKSNANNLAYKEGRNIYDYLSDILGSDKKASLLLNKYGIKGITYDGQRDGRCYVVFDDNAVKVLNTFYQEGEEEKLIAGYTYPEVLEKMTELYDEIGKGEIDAETEKRLMAKVHVLEDAFEVSEYPEKFSNEDRRHEIMLNAYYIMNDQEIPSDYIEAEALSTRTYNDLVKIHNEKKEKAEREYYGYFTQEDDKNVITIMANSNASTALHELGHLFLNGLNELAKASPQAQKQLDAVNKWLNFSGEYTAEQHEKFARSFEAYLYKGKAPNNYLKEVFERFKDWLKSVYHHITDIENRGADISPEVQEMFDNIFGGDSYYQERKEATSLLRKIKNITRKEKLEKIPVRDDNTLSDVEKRHKDVSYQILSAATGKDINYLKRIFETTSTKNGYGRRREIVEELLEHADDKITTSGGIREEWKEFYNDTGVSYENDEIGGDYELAEQALDVIINKAYHDPEKIVQNEADERAKYFEREVDNANRQYSALISEFKKGDRNVVLSAVYEWLNGLNPEIKEDYENRFIFDSGIIERDDKIDKFDKAKRKILDKALSFNKPYSSINNEESYKELVKEIMNSLNFLQPADKAKLTANILDVPNVNFLMSSIDNILDIAKTMEDINLRRKLEREIHKEIQGTKNVKKGGRTVGKYNYKSNKIFEELRSIDRLSPEVANERRLEEARLTKAEDEGLSYSEKLINKFLSYKAGGRTFADTELMKELYDEIVKIKLIGKSAKSELDLQEKLSEQKDVEELIKIVEKKKNAKVMTKAYISGLGNLESTLNAIFNKDIKERYGSEVLYAETNSQAWQHEQKAKFEKSVAEIYGLPQWCWDKKILEYLAEKHTYTEFRRKYDADNNLVKLREIDRTLTKMDIIQAYIWSKNEVLEKRLINQFGDDTLYTMFDELSLEDVKFAELLMHTAQSFYPLVNKAFIKKYGLDLPKVSCYFPSTPERGSEVDMYNDYSSKSLNNGFTKARSGSEFLPMDFHNPVTALYSHIDGVGKFAFMSESLDIANKRFKDNDLKRVIINKYGEDAYRTLEQILMNVTYKKEATVFNGVNKILDNMIGNWIQANVAVKPIVGLKQLLSANNYASEMPYMTWQAGFLKALANPQKTIDYMMKIPYLKARFEGNFSNEFLKQTIENSAFAMSKKLKDAMTMFIKLGDVGAIVFGGKPYIEYLQKEKGLTEEQAIKQFVLATNRTQQSSAVSSLSNFQVNMTRNPLGKLFIAFKNSPQQYMRMCGDAVVSCANGDMTPQQCAKVIYQYGYLQPFMYAVATSGSLLRYLFTGDDEELKGDAISSIFNLNADGLPVLGDLYLYAMRKGIMKEGYLPQTTPLTGDIQREIARISKEDVTLKDYLEAVGYMGLHVGMGYNSKAIGSMSSGVVDMTKGDVAQGALKVFGYTDKRAKHITGNEDK